MQQIGTALAAMATSLKAQLRLHGAHGDAGYRTTHLFLALTAMAGTMANRAVGGGGGRSASTSDARINEAVLAAADRLGGQDAEPTLMKLQHLATAAGQRQHKAGPALREGVTAAVRGKYGADISLVMHQEQLDAPRGATMSPSALRVWTLLFGVAQRLHRGCGRR